MLAAGDISELIRIFGGISVATLLACAVWAYSTGRVVARWYYDEMKSSLIAQLDAQRKRAELAEENVSRLVKLSARTVSTTEQIAEKTVAKGD